MPKAFNKAMILEIQKEIETQVLDRLDKIAIQVHARLTTQTPVDFGQARAGWNFALNAPLLKLPVVENKKRGADGKPEFVLTPPPSAPDQRARKIGDSYFITNCVEHVKFLNEGTSAQAPSNFIETETAAAVRDVEGSQ